VIPSGMVEARGKEARPVQLAAPDQLVFRRVWQISHELPDTDETVLFDQERSQLLVLSDSAAAIWYLIDGHRTIEEIVAFLRGEQPQCPSETDELVRRFVDQLETRGAIESVFPGAPQGSSSGSDAGVD